MAESRVVKKRLNNSYRCGYCRQHFIQLEDPRTLPCLHVYCMSCLVTDIRYRKTFIKCAYCSQEFHDTTDPTTLPVPKLGDPIEYRSPPKPPLIPCDVCEGKTRAVVFCVEIQRKLCTQHQEKHEGHMSTYTDTRHQFIPIDVYTASPQHYTTTKCKHHEHHQLTEACSECHQRFCVRCEGRGQCENATEGNTAPHNITSLSKLSDELRKTLTDKISILSEKISVLNDMSKDAWKELSELEEDAKKMITRVDNIANAKIEEIKSHSQKLKEEIRGYMRESGKIVDEYRIDLAWNKTLDKVTLLDSAQHMVDELNDAEIVKTYKEMSKKIESSLDVSMIQRCSIFHKILMSTGREDSLGLELLLPVRLQVDGLSTSKWYRRVNVTANGLLMCETNKGMEVRDADTLNYIRMLNKRYSTVLWGEIIQPEDITIGSYYNRKEKSAGIVILDPKAWQETRLLYKSSVEISLSYKIAQFQDSVYITDWANVQLIVCSLVDGKIRKFPLPGMEDPRPVCVLPDCTVLIADRVADGKVRKYKIEDSTLIKLWTLSHIPKPTGISYEPASKLIYICTEKGPLITVSTEGKLIGEISRQDLDVSDSVLDIAVYKDKAVLGCADSGLRRYTIG